VEPMVPLSHLTENSGRRITVAGVRLPGWTGGEGFFLGDGDMFVVARQHPSQKALPAWQPLLIRGRWVGDEWGDRWLQVEEVTLL
jgi:hypothetical protein